MRYTLLNKLLDRKLTHPIYGVWATPDLDEARDMLDACKEHLVIQGLTGLQDKFVIVEEEAGKEIL